MFINFQLDKKQFRKEYLYQEPYVFRKSIQNDNFKWEDVNELYSRCDISHRDFKLMNGYEVPKDEYIESYDNLGVVEYRCITSTFYNYLRNGATLVRNRIRNEPFVDHISRQISKFAEARTLTGGYAAFSSKSSYKSHWDTRDVYAVQLLGRKRWILKKPNFELPLYMQQTKDFPEIQEPKDIYMDVILEAGDILYIPRGWWHDPLPLDEETFHLAVATFPPTGFEYMRWLQNITPSILECRKNLTEIDLDKNIISNLSSQVGQLIENESYYQSFMMQHLLDQSTPSMFSLDILGNGKAKKLSADQIVSLNASSLYLFKGKTLVINGRKLNIDEKSFKIFELLSENTYSKVGDIISKFPKHKEEDINILIFNLALENIIELVNIKS